MSQQDDSMSNTSSNPYLMQVLEAGLSDPMRRVWLKRGAGVAALPLMGGAAALLAACGSTDPAPSNPTRPSALGFGAVAKSVTDTLVVASGYTANVLFRLGDPMSATTSAYSNNGTDAAASFATRAGDHHDGMQYFGLGEVTGCITVLPAASVFKSACTSITSFTKPSFISHKINITCSSAFVNSLIVLFSFC